MGAGGVLHLPDPVRFRKALTGQGNCENEPRKRVLYSHAVDGGLSGSTLLVTVPFWDKRKIGELIRVRIGTGSGSQIKVDRFFYLHLVSMSILAGYVTLLGIISPLYFFNKGTIVTKIRWNRSL